jgi:hypothetical protein
MAYIIKVVYFRYVIGLYFHTKVICFSIGTCLSYRYFISDTRERMEHCVYVYTTALNDIHDTNLYLTRQDYFDMIIFFTKTKKIVLCKKIK